MTTCIDKFRRRYPNDGILGLAAGFRHSNRTFSGEEYVSGERLSYRKFLETKNFTAVNFSKRYVKWSA